MSNDSGARGAPATGAIRSIEDAAAEHYARLAALDLDSRLPVEAVEVTDPDARAAHEAHDVAGFCWAVRVAQAPRRPAASPRGVRALVVFRRGVTRRDSRRCSTVRRSPGTRKRTSTASRDDGGGGEPSGSPLVGLRAGQGVTP